ncbi:oligopeptide/dipeptide ABC transporter ATP-binding protein, partial [uncultured Maritalea sp.]
PVPDPEVEKTREHIVLKGDVPSPANPPSGCRFSTRCPVAQKNCFVDDPEWRKIGDGGYVACHYAE